MKVLLLAGTNEARRLAGLLAASGHDATASLAGATRHPDALPIPTRRGGFGGEEVQRTYMQNNGFEVILDATHPFAHAISRRSARIARDLGLAYLQILRPPWQPGPGDDWTPVASGREAGLHIPPGATVFLATGRGSLSDFAHLAGRRLICRQIDPPEAPFPYENGEFLVGRPPFSLAEEVALFQARNVDWLVVKNAGGSLSRSKLDAARALGLPVLMIARPAQPPGDKVETAPAAMAWLEARA